jgi:hypothetical protein
MFARNPHRGTAPAPCRRGLPLVLLALLLASACGGPAKGPESTSLPGEWKSFEGSGTATGHRQTLLMGPDHKVNIFNFSGSLLLIGERRLGRGFRIDLIGSADSLKGGTGWSVWTDTGGDQVLSEIRGERIGTGARILGTLVGGTGRFAGVTGEYEFEWQFVIESEDGNLQGRITGLRGRFRQDVPSSSPDRKSSSGKNGSIHEPA